MVSVVRSLAVFSLLFAHSVVLAQPRNPQNYTEEDPIELEELLPDSSTTTIYSPDKDTNSEPKEVSPRPVNTSTSRFAAPEGDFHKTKSSKTSIDKTWQDKISFFAYLRLAAVWVQNDPNVAFIGRNDGFSLEDARLGIDAQISKKLRFILSIDGATDVRDDPNATQGTLTVLLRDAFAEAQLLDKVDIRVGRFKPTIDREEFSSTRHQQFVTRALSSRGVQTTLGWEAQGLGIQRDLGIAFRSDTALTLQKTRIGYEVAVQNGAGAIDTANDNDSVAVSAAIMVNNKNMSAHVAARTNTRAVGELPTLRQEVDELLAFALAWHNTNLYIGGQALLRSRTFATTNAFRENALGIHVQAATIVPRIPQLSVAYRYSILDPSNQIDTDRVQEHTLGLTWDNHPYRFLVNYVYPVEQTGRNLKNQRVEFLWQASL